MSLLRLQTPMKCELNYSSQNPPSPQKVAYQHKTAPKCPSTAYQLQKILSIHTHGKMDMGWSLPSSTVVWALTVMTFLHHPNLVPVPALPPLFPKITPFLKWLSSVRMHPALCVCPSTAYQSDGKSFEWEWCIYVQLVWILTTIKRKSLLRVEKNKWFVSSYYNYYSF